MTNASRHYQRRGSGLLLCLTMAVCTILSGLASPASAQQATDLPKLDWSVIQAPATATTPAAAAIQSAPERVIERAIEAQGLDFSIIAKKVPEKLKAKPVLEIVYGSDCAPCQTLIRAYNGPKNAKLPTRLRQFLDQTYEIRWIKHDQSDIERRRWQTLTISTMEAGIPLFVINGGPSHVVGFDDSESLIAALTAKMPNPVPIRQSK